MWRTDSQGRRRAVRMTYEIATFQALRERLRCKDIWVVGADRWRNPDQDLPADFDDRRAEHYRALRKPLDATAFIASVGMTIATPTGARLVARSPIDGVTDDHEDRPEPASFGEGGHGGCCARPVRRRAGPTSSARPPQWWTIQHLVAEACTSMEQLVHHLMVLEPQAQRVRERRGASPSRRSALFGVGRTGL